MNSITSGVNLPVRTARPPVTSCGPGLGRSRYAEVSSLGNEAEQRFRRGEAAGLREFTHSAKCGEPDTEQPPICGQFTPRGLPLPHRTRARFPGEFFSPLLYGFQPTAASPLTCSSSLPSPPFHTLFMILRSQRRCFNSNAPLG